MVAGQADLAVAPTYRHSVRGGLRQEMQPSPSRLPFTAESRARLDGLLAERGMAAAYRSNRGINLEPCEDWVPGPIMSVLILTALLDL